NPYALGFAMWRDIQRICTAPTDEDREWFPGLAGSDWRESMDFAMRNFKDESFIAQYLSPKLMREFRLFNILDDADQPRLRIEAIHDEQGYRMLRQRLADQYNLGSREPDIQVWNVDLRGERSLTLRHFTYQGRPLGETRDAMLKHVATLWGFPVRLEEQDASGAVKLLTEVKIDRRHNP
ncbi:MAG: SpoVR family protein, partial [Rhodocyclaceae bacterium]|nr:SpoVR family protein [Rhodocyclaceae bacterium]